MTTAAARIERAISGARQLSALTFPELLLVETKAHWDRLKANPFLESRRLADQSLIGLPLPRAVHGYCSGCASFQGIEFGAWWAEWAPDGALHLALSETGACPVCRINSRMRFALDICAHRLREGSVYITEQTTALFQRIQMLNPSVIGSEYLGPNKPSGSTIDGLRHEDLMNLSLASGSVDVVLCLDVLEHVPDPVRGLTEISRVLKPGGLGVVTFPFFCDQEQTVRRSDIAQGGEITHLLDPVYHGNPLGGGALVFNDIAWDVLEQAKAAGVQLGMVNYWSLYRAHFGQARFACVITK